MSKLPAHMVSHNLKQLNDWFLIEDRITKIYKFPDFTKALKFVNEVGAVAEKLGHHPDILLSWGKVIITSTTHDAGGLTDKDFNLATKIDHIKLTNRAKA